MGKSGLEGKLKSLIPLDSFLDTYQNGQRDYEDWNNVMNGARDVDRHTSTIRQWVNETYTPASVKGVRGLRQMNIFPLYATNPKLVALADLAGFITTEGNIGEEFSLSIFVDSQNDYRYAPGSPSAVNHVLGRISELGWDGYARHHKVAVRGVEAASGNVLARALVAFGVKKGKKMSGLDVPEGIMHCAKRKHPNARRAVQAFLAAILNTQTETRPADTRELRLPQQATRKSAERLSGDIAELLRTTMNVPLHDNAARARPKDDPKSPARRWVPFVYMRPDAVKHIRQKYSHLINGRFEAR